MTIAAITVMTPSIHVRNRLRRTQSPGPAAGSGGGSGGGNAIVSVEHWIHVVMVHRSTIARRRLARLTTAEITNDSPR